MRKQLGFHLIELLIVLSIMGILLAFTMPQYSVHIANERRLAAETALMKLAGDLEAFKAQYNTYDGATLERLQQPEFIAQNNYKLVIQAATANHFELAAIPEQHQAEIDKQCGTLMLNSHGVKRIGGNGNISECW